MRPASPGFAVSVEARPGAMEGATVVQLKCDVACGSASASSSLSMLVTCSDSLNCEGLLCSGEGGTFSVADSDLGAGLRLIGGCGVSS